MLSINVCMYTCTSNLFSTMRNEDMCEDVSDPNKTIMRVNRSSAASKLVVVLPWQWTQSVVP